MLTSEVSELRLIAVTVAEVLRGDAQNRLVRTFRPRRRKLGPVLSQTYERMRDAWSIAEHGGELDLAETFGNNNPVILEIGCGRGDLAVDFAPTHRDINLIAIDIHTRGIANVLTAVEGHGLLNARVVEGDVLVFLQRLPAGSMHELWIFFPDPWPKPREHRRRLFRENIVQEFGRVLAPGGVLRLATDIEDYWRKSLLIVANSGLFDEAVAERPEWRIETVFERRGLAEKRPAADWSWRRKF